MDPKGDHNFDNHIYVPQTVSVIIVVIVVFVVDILSLLLVFLVKLLCLYAKDRRTYINWASFLGSELGPQIFGNSRMLGIRGRSCILDIMKLEQL